MSRFDTEAKYDYVSILRLERSGFQDVLYQWSGSIDQVLALRQPSLLVLDPA